MDEQPQRPALRVGDRVLLNIDGQGIRAVVLDCSKLKRLGSVTLGVAEPNNDLSAFSWTVPTVPGAYMRIP